MEEHVAKWLAIGVIGFMTAISLGTALAKFAPRPEKDNAEIINLSKRLEALEAKK